MGQHTWLREFAGRGTSCLLKLGDQSGAPGFTKQTPPVCIPPGLFWSFPVVWFALVWINGSVSWGGGLAWVFLRQRLKIDEASLELTVLPKTSLLFCSSSLHLQSAGIQAWTMMPKFMWCWRRNPRLHSWQANTLPSTINPKATERNSNKIKSLKNKNKTELWLQMCSQRELCHVLHSHILLIFM